MSSAELTSVRDLLRYAVTRFNASGLYFGHGTHNALDEAAFLITEALYLPHDKLELLLDAQLLHDERQRCLALLESRITTRKPAPYLVGKAYIGGIPFQVDERVIVPRSFIGHILQSDLMRARDDALIESPLQIRSVLDLCTGSGCLAILAAHAFPNARVDAIDLSPDALEVAQANVTASGCADRIRLLRGDLFAPVEQERYDLILTNPPYVDAAAMASLPAEYRHEPQMALAGGSDGLDFVRRILDAARKHLHDGGGLLCEVGSGRAAVESAFPDLAFRWLADDTCFWLQTKGLEPATRM
jgi:ribosomal protein L3 glutamine methyltransferase